MKLEPPDVQTGFRKGRGSRDQILNICWTMEKASSSASLTTLKHLTVWITTNWKILEDRGVSGHLTCIIDFYMQVKKQQLELDMEQLTGSKLGKEYNKVIYCHPVYLTYMQTTLIKIPGWQNHKLESRLQGEISITSDMQMTPHLWQKVKKN